MAEMKFEVGDLVRDRESGKIGRIVSLPAYRGNEACIQEPGSDFGYGISWHSFDDLEDVYEYEREAGHYGLTPKGVTPPQEA